MTPGSSLIGAATELGLAIDWRFIFVDAGSVVSRSTDVVYLDVGGHLEPGVVDHHQGEPGATSAARLVLEHPGLVHEHLVGPWISIAKTHETQGRAWSPAIGLHASPDFDAIVSTALAMHLVETGSFPARAKPLVDYADRVDQGAERPTLPERRFELYPLILMLQNLPGDAGHRARTGLPTTMPTREDLVRERLLAMAAPSIADRWRALPDADRTTNRLAEWIGAAEARSLARASADELTLRLGLHLVGRWLASNTGTLQDDPVATRLAEALEADAHRFKQAMPRVGSIAIAAPSVDRLAAPIEGIDAAIMPLAADDPGDRGIVACDKIYLRGGLLGLPKPFPVTAIEKVLSGQKPDGVARSRWIIAIDEATPPSDPAARANLRGLGASLEWAERRKRALHGADPRTGAARYPEYAGIADPWYDGRGHHWTIVDSPRDGTVLDRLEIESILSSRFWEPEIATSHAVAWRAAEVVDHLEDRPPATRIDRLAIAMHEPVRGAQRLGDAIRDVASVSDDRPLYAMLVAHLRRGWDDASIMEPLRELLGGSPAPVALSCGRALVGAGACVVLLDDDADAFEPASSLDRLFSLLHDLQTIDREAQSLGTQTRRDGSIALCRRLRQRYVTSAAAYRGRPSDGNADARSLQSAIEQALGLDARLAATGQLIEHLDEESQRDYEGRLNRIGFVLAAFVLAEVGIAACDAVVASGHLGGAEGGFATWWPVVAGGIYLLLLAMAISLLMHRLDHWWAARPILGPLLFPELRSHGTASPRAADSSPHRNRSHR